MNQKQFTNKMREIMGRPISAHYSEQEKERDLAAMLKLGFYKTFSVPIPCRFTDPETYYMSYVEKGGKRYFLIWLSKERAPLQLNDVEMNIVIEGVMNRDIIGGVVFDQKIFISKDLIKEVLFGGKDIRIELIPKN